MFQKYTKDILTKMDNGWYLMKSDPNEYTDYWPPNDEIVELKDGEIISDINIKLDISGVSNELVQLKGNIQKLPHNGGGPVKFLLNGKVIDVYDII